MAEKKSSESSESKKKKLSKSSDAKPKKPNPNPNAKPKAKRPPQSKKVYAKTRGPGSRAGKDFYFVVFNASDHKIRLTSLFEYFGFPANGTKENLRKWLMKIPGFEGRWSEGCAFPQGYIYLTKVDWFLKNVQEWDDANRQALMLELDPQYSEKRYIELEETRPPPSTRTKKRERDEDNDNNNDDDQEEEVEEDSLPESPPIAASNVNADNTAVVVADPAPVVPDNTDHNEGESNAKRARVESEEDEEDELEHISLRDFLDAISIAKKAKKNKQKK